MTNYNKIEKIKLNGIELYNGELNIICKRNQNVWNNRTLFDF